MDFDNYQEQAMKTAIYDKQGVTYGIGTPINYPILGLVGEAGELANKYKKVLRDDNGVLTDEKRLALIDELGDVLWYCAALARDLGTNLGLVASQNIVKLQKRRSEGTISGSGDNR